MVLLMLPLSVKGIHELNAGEYPYGNVHKTALLTGDTAAGDCQVSQVGALRKILLLRGVSSLLFTRALNPVIFTS